MITRDLLWVPDEGYRIIQMKTIPGDPPSSILVILRPVPGKSMKICLIEPDGTLFSFRDLPVPPLSQGRYHFAGFLDSNLEDLDHVYIKGLNNLCLYDLAR